MAQTIRDILARHEAEIEKFKAECPHEELSDWLSFMWAPGHFGPNMVKACIRCGKIMKERPKTVADTLDSHLRRDGE